MTKDQLAFLKAVAEGSSDYAYDTTFWSDNKNVLALIAEIERSWAEIEKLKGRADEPRETQLLTTRECELGLIELDIANPAYPPGDQRRYSVKGKELLGSLLLDSGDEPSGDPLREALQRILDSTDNIIAQGTTPDPQLAQDIFDLAYTALNRPVEPKTNELAELAVKLVETRWVEDDPDFYAAIDKLGELGRAALNRGGSQ